jgi:hypothetical protein
LAKTVSFLGISGTIQAEDGVVHLVAEHLWEPKNELKPALVTSRDFVNSDLSKTSNADTHASEIRFKRVTSCHVENRDKNEALAASAARRNSFVNLATFSLGKVNWRTSETLSKCSDGQSKNKKSSCGRSFRT